MKMKMKLIFNYIIFNYIIKRLNKYIYYYIIKYFFNKK